MPDCLGSSHGSFPLLARYSTCLDFIFLIYNMEMSMVPTSKLVHKSVQDTVRTGS